MLIDCDTCAVRNIHCSDCIVTALLDPSGSVLELDDAEQDALGALAGAGLLPPLRLVPALSDPQVAPPARRSRTGRGGTSAIA